MTDDIFQFTEANKHRYELLGRTNRLLSLIGMGHAENDASNNSSIVACVFVTAVTFIPSCCLATIGGFLPSRCLATIGGFLQEPLPNDDRRLHMHTHRQQRDLISLLHFLK
jgi:hypothetical protein